MVKIVNPLGDVKTGKQGEVVYQRKYGEQIRRQASPKRAIASEAQIAHRQLYRDALAWRKQLSLPNRRYLDGYCIANGIVDGYHIPLPWSRFALKVYLQVVKFIVIEKPILTYELVEGKMEAYDNEALLDHQVSCWGNTWYAQTFIPLQTHKLTKVELFLKRYSTPGTATCSIKNTDGSGHPTGADLDSFVFDGNTLPTGFIWKEMDLEYSELTEGVKYAIVLRAPTGASNRYIHWRRDIGDAIYPRGNDEWSSNGGSSWTSITADDLGFREYGEYETGEKKAGLLHVRHPALLKVLHKREGLNINGYDTLSSLDEEYLTGQVGLDVHVGDIIKATTLPGIEKAYLIR